MSVATAIPQVRGKLTPNAPLAPLVWFKSGGAAEWLFEPADADDLASFLRGLDPAVPVMGLGLGSNLIVRDGGVPGVVVRLGKPFATAERLDPLTLKCGGGASPPQSRLRWTGSHRRARSRSRCAAGPAARPSRIRFPTRRGR